MWMLYFFIIIIDSIIIVVVVIVFRGLAHKHIKVFLVTVS